MFLIIIYFIFVVWNNNLEIHRQNGEGEDSSIVRIETIKQCRKKALGRLNVLGTESIPFLGLIITHKATARVT